METYLSFRHSYDSHSPHHQRSFYPMCHPIFYQFIMREDEVKWDKMRWDEAPDYLSIHHTIRWDEMRRHDMTWHDMTWHDMTWYDMRWDEMGWDVWWDEKYWRNIYYTVFTAEPQDVRSLFFSLRVTSVSNLFGMNVFFSVYITVQCFKTQLICCHVNNVKTTLLLASSREHSSFFAHTAVLCFMRNCACASVVSLECVFFICRKDLIFKVTNEN